MLIIKTWTAFDLLLSFNHKWSTVIHNSDPQPEW